MIMKKKFLTIGRHGAYDFTSSMPLLDYSMVEAFYRGKQLKSLSGGVNKIYSSPMARANVTACLNAIGAGGDENQVTVLKQLTESASQNTLRIVWEDLKNQCESSDLNHLHLVTHLPVIDTLSYLFFKFSYFVAPGECLVLESDSWKNIFAGKVQASKLPAFEPNMLSIYQSRLFGTKRKDINKVFDGVKNVNPEEVFDYLEEISNLNEQFDWQKICTIFKNKTLK